MAEENRLRTAAGYPEIWDGQAIQRVRAQDGVSVLPGRRLSMHLMVQPETAAKFLSDKLLRDQGFLSRVLVASPDSIAGTRFYREPSDQDNAAIRDNGARILAMLEAPWPLAGAIRNELTPRVLTISDEAAAAWRAFHDHIEQSCAEAGDLRPIRDFAAKIAEHAVRIAGVLTIAEDIHATVIQANAMIRDLTLADWYVDEPVVFNRPPTPIASCWWRSSFSAGCSSAKRRNQSPGYHAAWAGQGTHEGSSRRGSGNSCRTWLGA